ncbi:hypothetical protein MOTT12_02594 [Mycobacterium intracellulare subsp. yongonense]|nr:hypothetical protein MOTT12_02594 [Mycobacterium intracellulare subsp. yongonense]ARR83348.1 hypothetical protein MOTT27_02527 [Mycobacterium intracellulare subsp. yongonense]
MRENMWKEPIQATKRGRGRIATKWSSIWDTDYHRDSFRSHLLAARAYGDAIRCTRG